MIQMTHKISWNARRKNRKNFKNGFKEKSDSDYSYYLFLDIFFIEI